MKFKRTLFFYLILIMMITLVGCKSSKQTVQTEEPVIDEKDNFTPIKEEKIEKLKYGEITDPIVLEKLWQDYLYDSIATIGNSHKFNSPEEIEPMRIVKYCFYKYASEHGIDDLEIADGNGYWPLFPLDKAIAYSNRYFNFTNINLSEISIDEYDPEKQVFIFSSFNVGSRPLYTDRNSFGVYLDKVIKNSDDTITVVLVHYVSYDTKLIDRTKTYTLKEREDGSLYFIDGIEEYINNNLVTLTGEYDRFEKISGFEGDMQDLTMVGEVDNKLILAYTPYNKKALLMLVNIDNLSVEKQLDLKDSISYRDVKFTGDKILVFLKDKVLNINTNFEQLEDIPLPEVISEKIEREPNYDEDGFPDIHFGGYDVSNDMKNFVYCDEIGVKLVNTLDNSEKLLSKTIDFEGARLLKHSYHSSPKFVAGDKKIITVMTGYESTYGYTICDISSDTSKFYDISNDYPDIIRYDTGIIMINRYTHDYKSQNGDYISLYLDFKTGELINIKLKDTGETGDIIDPSYYFVGKNFASFITYTWDGSDNSNNMHYINRLDLNTMNVESQIISLKAARTFILGVLSDGRTLFYYYLNPSENGICITK